MSSICRGEAYWTSQICSFSLQGLEAPNPGCHHKFLVAFCPLGHALHVPSNMQMCLSFSAQLAHHPHNLPINHNRHCCSSVLATHWQTGLPHTDWPHTVATSLSRCLITFLPLTRLMRCRRSLARWQLSLAWPKGTSRAGAASIFSSVDATCTPCHTPVGQGLSTPHCCWWLAVPGMSHGSWLACCQPRCMEMSQYAVRHRAASAGTR